MSPAARTATVLALVGTLLAIAAPAWAHVEATLSDPRPGALSRYTLSVPNESETANTVRLDVRLPAGLEFDRGRERDGWTFEVGDGVLSISGGSIPPGERGAVVFFARNPRQAGEVALPVIQVYDDGEEGRWIGEAGEDNPAPVVTIEGEPVAPPATDPAPPTEEPATSEATEPAPATEPPTTEPAATEPAAPATDAATDGAAPPGDNGGTSPLVWIAAGLGAIGVVLGSVALTRSRSAKQP